MGQGIISLKDQPASALNKWKPRPKILLENVQPVQKLIKVWYTNGFNFVLGFHHTQWYTSSFGLLQLMNKFYQQNLSTTAYHTFPHSESKCVVFTEGLRFGERLIYLGWYSIWQAKRQFWDIWNDWKHCGGLSDLECSTEGLTLASQGWRWKVIVHTWVSGNLEHTSWKGVYQVTM